MRFFFLAGLANMLLLGACTTGNTKQSETTSSFPVTHPLRMDTALTNTYVAEIRSLQNIEIRSRVKGFIEQVHVDEGQEVVAGQLLFSLSAQELQEALLSARALTRNAIAELKAAEIEFANARSLLEKAIVSEAQLQLAQSKVEALKAKLEEARANESNAALQLSFASIKAPFSGIINRIPFKKGSLVDEGALLTSLSDNREVFAYFNLSEADYLNFRIRQQQGKEDWVGLEMANGLPFGRLGKIETVEGEIDKATGNIAFRARFGNPGQVLRHGSTGKISWREKLPDALLIPQKSVLEIQDKNWVYVLDAQRKLKLKPVSLSHRLSRIYVVKDGLAENETILLEGVQQVKEGQSIEAKALRMEEVMKQLNTGN
jgi:membrane fusion protein (multidrug efflux system)